MPPPVTESDDFRSDEELARSHQRGDATAFVELVHRHEQRLRAFVFGDPTWAAAGNALVRHIWAAAHQAIREGRFRGGSFRVWLFKVAEAVASRKAGPPPTPRSERLTRCFGRLFKANPKWHQLVMWVSHGLNRTAIARRYRMDKATLKDRYTRTVAAVRDCLTKQTEAAADESNEGAAP